MVEAAYILPLIILVIMFMVETLNYSLNTFAVSDVVYDLHSRAISEVAEVASSGQSSSGIAKCNNSKVELDRTIMASIAKEDLLLKGSDFKNTTVDMTSSVVSGFDVYVVTVKTTAKTVLVPELMADLPISVDTIISVKESCTAPP